MISVLIKNKLVADFEASEAVKRLRTNVVFSGADVKVIGLTSCYELDGKTTVSFNLAASLAQTGKKVVLLDTDLRKSILIHYAERNTRISGLGHYLSGMADVEDIICATDVPNFNIIFAGARVPNPAELLGSDRFTTLIHSLRESFDYVIVDTPPLGRVVDCAIMSPMLDGILIVVNAQRNSYKIVRNVKSQLERANGKIIGIVLNKVDFGEKRSYYGGKYGKYGHYYKYYYGDSRTSTD